MIVNMKTLENAKATYIQHAHTHTYIHTRMHAYIHRIHWVQNFMFPW